MRGKNEVQSELMSGGCLTCFITGVSECTFEETFGIYTESIGYCDTGGIVNSVTVADCHCS